MTRIVATVDEAALQFAQGVPVDRFLHSIAFTGREIGTVTQYQRNAVVHMARTIRTFMAATRAMVQDASSAVEAAGGARPGDPADLRPVRAVNPFVEPIEVGGEEALPPALRPERLGEAVSKLDELLAAPDELTSPAGLREFRALTRELGQVQSENPELMMQIRDPSEGPGGGGTGPSGPPTTETAPAVQRIQPVQGVAGSTVTLTGKRFGSRASGKLLFGTTPASISSWESTRITAVVPALASGPVEVTVESNVDSSAPVTFTVVASPADPPGGGGPADPPGGGSTGTTDPGPSPGGGLSSEAVEAVLRSSVGYPFYDRTRVSPAGFALGEHMTTLSLAPAEEVTIEQKTFTKRDLTLDEELSEERQVDVETNSVLSTELSDALTRERTLALKSDIAHRSSFQGGFKLSEVVDLNASASLDVSASLSQADQTTRAETSKRSFQRTQKVASKLRGAHRTTIKVATESGFERNAKRVIRNPNRGTALDLHMFKVVQSVRLTHERCGVRLCWAPYVKDPGSAARRRAAAASAAAGKEVELDLTLPEKPAEPVVAERARRTGIGSLSVNDKFGFWNDMSVDVDVLVDAAGLEWDGADPVVTLSFDQPRGAGAHAIGSPVRDGTRYRVPVHVGIDWVLFGRRGNARVEVKLGLIETAQQDVAEAMRTYRKDLAAWESQVASSGGRP
jgi:IPT/TIG domain